VARTNFSPVKQGKIYDIIENLLLQLAPRRTTIYANNQGLNFCLRSLMPVQVAIFDIKIIASWRINLLSCYNIRSLY